MLLAGLGLLALSPSAHAAVLAGWETWTAGGRSATTVATGVTAFSTEGAGDWREASQAASNDGTFGTVSGASTATGAAASGTHIGQTTSSGEYTFTITAGAVPLTLEGFHFDARRKRAGSPAAWVAAVISGNITIGQLGNGTLGNTLGTVGPSDHDDFNFDLTALADNLLAPGESATFRISFSGGTVSNTDQITYLDNVAITGIPEPGAALLGGLGLLALLRRRRP
jgi:MYXO-CTERM domain-containing protein